MPKPKRHRHDVLTPQPGEIGCFVRHLDSNGVVTEQWYLNREQALKMPLIRRAAGLLQGRKHGR